MMNDTHVLLSSEHVVVTNINGEKSQSSRQEPGSSLPHKNHAEIPAVHASFIVGAAQRRRRPYRSRRYFFMRTLHLVVLLAVFAILLPRFMRGLFHFYRKVRQDLLYI